LPVGLAELLGFIILRSFSFWQASQQQQLIVYNVPQHQAIDFIDGRDYLFKGDSILSGPGFLQNFNLKPSRIMHRMSETDKPASLQHGTRVFEFGSKRILIIDQNISLASSATKTIVDVIIISKNPSLKISNLVNAFDCNKWVFDCSNSSWKTNKWQKECEQLHLSSHAVVDKGAFVLNLD
jgi:competence protein ComEC